MPHDRTHDRRAKRSNEPRDALQLLVDAVADRSDVEAFALVDGDRVVAGAGSSSTLADLARIAATAARGELSPDVAAACVDTDVMARDLSFIADGLVLAAIGRRVTRMHEAASAVARILRAAPCY